ncbi:hypothetical protein H4217_004914 [Coemansia sp. RSA 1939]|nr:hypothetical protein H4217_004914 [Coemansia sp. RSA 1939]
MIFAFLIDTSVSMEQELSSVLPASSERKVDEQQQQQQQPNDSLFGGEKDRVNRRWQRKNLGPGAASAKTHRTTRLDCAKSIVEQIVANRHFFDNDKYMLVTYGGASGGCIRSNLKDSRATLLTELRNLEAKDRFSGGMSLTALFDQLSLMRGAYDLDTYGYGRYPTLNEPVHIIWLTDGASVVTPSGVQNKLNLPVNNTPWVEAYLEPFRWDQRMILLFLHDQGDGILCSSKKHSSESTLMPMCSVMGGTVHHIGSMHQAQRFVESFTPARATPNSYRTQGQAMANVGVLVNFERIDDNPANPGNTDLRTLLHTTPCTITNAPLPSPTEPNIMMNGPTRSVGSGASYGNSAGVTALINGHLGYFPIPEAFWPETISPPRGSAGAPGSGQQQAGGGGGGSNSWQISRRNAHPTLGYSQASTEWSVPPQFPFDKYQIDANSNVAQKLLAAAQAAQIAHETQGGKGQAKPICWPVFVNGSYSTAKNSGFPFGILRPNSARTAVNLFVLPYNFMALWKILGKLDAHMPGEHPNRNAIALSQSWRHEFEEYLQHTPGYYAIPLKRALNLYGVPHGVFPKSFGQSSGMRNITHYSIRLHNIARKEWDRMHPGSGAEARPGSVASAKERAIALQQALLSFDPASDVSHLANNAFDVDRSHCLATLSAMRRVFVRECMATQGAYFRANAVVPPSPSENTVQLDGDKSHDMDVDSDSMPLSTPPLLRVGSGVSSSLPPVASMEYSLYGVSNALESSRSSPYLPQQPPGNRQPFGAPGKQRALDPDMQQLVPGMQLSPLGGLVDIASEDDRDSRHSVPIRDMGEYGAAMHRIRTHEARDPLLDERTALQQRRNMFGNPYRRPMREPRGPTNNVLARNPELSAKLGLARASSSRSSVIGAFPATAGGGNNNGGGGGGGSGSSISPASRPEAEDEAGTAAGLEMESEAEINELAIDKMFEDMPLNIDDESKNSGSGSKYWWMQRRNVPRRRSINAPWRKNDESWNVNPWDVLAPVEEGAETEHNYAAGNKGGAVADLGALTYTADALIIDRQTAQVLKSIGANTGTSGAPIQSTGQAPIANMAPPSLPEQQDTMPMHVDEEDIDDYSSGSQDKTLLDMAGNEDKPQHPAVGGAAAIEQSKDYAEQEQGPNQGQEPGSNTNEAGQQNPAYLPLDTSSMISTVPPVYNPGKLELQPPGLLPAAKATTSGNKVNVASEKAWFMKRIKADPAHYDEEAIVQHLADLQKNPTLGKPHLKIIVTAAIVAAKSMRRKQLISRLERVVTKDA